MQDISCTTACSCLHPNGIYILQKLKPLSENHFCCLVPTTRAILIFSRGWLWIFWYCYALGTREVFVFTSCFFKCCSPAALQKPHKGHSSADLKFSWCHEPQTSWEWFKCDSCSKVRAQNQEQSNCWTREVQGVEGWPTSPHQPGVLSCFSCLPPSDKQNHEELLSPANCSCLSLFLVHSVTKLLLLVRLSL